METTGSAGGFVVLAPLGKRRTESEPASRAASIDRGSKLVVGMLDEGWSPPYFEAMRPFFEQRWGSSLETRHWKKPLMSAPSPLPLVEEVAAACGAVVVGVGH